MKEYIERKAVCNDCDNLKICVDKSLCPVGRASAADVVERKRGEWVMKETMIRSLYAKNAYCSECLEETGFCHNFCPNCGADMRGEKHEAD